MKKKWHGSASSPETMGSAFGYGSTVPYLQGVKLQGAGKAVAIRATPIRSSFKKSYFVPCLAEPPVCGSSPAHPEHLEKKKGN